MNREWMRQRLEQFVQLAELRHSRYQQMGYRAELEDINAALLTALPTIRQIVRLLDRSLEGKLSEPTGSLVNSANLAVAQQALGILRDMDEWRANLEPDAPSLVADQFHPHVWPAAAALWETGQYRVAVQQAAVALSVHIATTAGSSLAERGLVQQVFSPSEPRAGQVRLHFPGDKASDNWKSRQDGLHLLAQGAFAGIRNIATHTVDEWTEQVGLEHLAVLSVVARWADETELVKAP
jgi:hypothetical protein